MGFKIRKLRTVQAPADPFVVVVHNSKVLFRTKTLKDDLNPVWNHTETCEVDPSGGDLCFIVFDDDEGEANWIFGKDNEDDYIGKCNVPLKTQTKEHTLAAPKPSGKNKLIVDHVGKKQTKLKVQIQMPRAAAALSPEGSCCDGIQQSCA